MAQRRSSLPRKQMSFRVATTRSFFEHWRRPMRMQGNSAGRLKSGNSPYRSQTGKARLPTHCNGKLPVTKLVSPTGKALSVNGLRERRRGRGLRKYSGIDSADMNHKYHGLGKYYSVPPQAHSFSGDCLFRSFRRYLLCQFASASPPKRPLTIIRWREFNRC